jgi:hypothetical protein
MMYMGDVMQQDALRFDRIVPARDRSALPRIFLASDSFGAWIAPFLEDRASKLGTNSSYTFPVERILADRPDVVIELFNEYWLTEPLPALAEGAFEMETRETFERYPKLSGPIDPTAGPPAVTTRGRVATEVRRANGRSALAFQMRSADAALVLSGPSLPTGSRIAVHVAIEAPVELDLLLGYRRHGESEFTRSQMVPIGLRPGRNDVCVRIRAADADGTLLLRAPIGHELALYELEVRAQP